MHVYPGFIKEALDKEKLEPEPILRRSFREKLADLGSFLLEQKLYKKHPRMRLLRTLKRAEDVVQIMLEVLSGLPNVTDYYVTWCGLPSISATAAPFLSTVFQANLQKLSLELSLENVKNLLTPSFQVQKLKELHLCIHSEGVAPRQSGHIMQRHLAPAISCLASTLEILSLQSWEPTDLSPMFTAIAPLSRLDQLIVAIPIESVHLGEPSGLAQFLSANRHTLRVLRLRATQYGGPGFTPNLASFDFWIRHAISGVNLPNLRILDTSSNLFPVGTSLLCLDQFCSTITSLSLTGSYRTYDEAEAVIKLIASNTRQEPLSTLRIGLVALSPQVLHLISSRLPRLYRLDLVVKYILPHAHDLPNLRNPGDMQRTSQIVSIFRLFLHSESQSTCIPGGLPIRDGRAHLLHLAIAASICVGGIPPVQTALRSAARTGIFGVRAIDYDIRIAMTMVPQTAHILFDKPSGRVIHQGDIEHLLVHGPRRRDRHWSSPVDILPSS